MDSNDKYKSTIGFIDLLFNILVGFVFLFLIAFILINPVAKKADILSPSEFIITMIWPNELDDDMDVWVKDPLGNVVGFLQREVGIMHLERDDLGLFNDSILVDGQQIFVYRNQENVSIRGILPGTYSVSVHFYRRGKDILENIPVTVEVLKVNPHRIIYTQTQNLNSQGQEVQFYKFTVEKNGHVSKIETGSESIVPTKRSSNLANP